MTEPHDTATQEAQEGQEQTVLDQAGREVVPLPDESIVEPQDGETMDEYRQRQEANEIKRQERRLKVLELRKMGANLRQIAKKLEISPATAMRDLHLALEELHEQEVKEAKLVRALESDRLDTMLAAVWPQAKQGVPVAVDIVMKIQGRKAAMYGLDAAVKVDVLMNEERNALLELLQKNLPEDDFKKVLGVLAVSTSV